MDPLLFSWSILEKELFLCQFLEPMTLRDLINTFYFARFSCVTQSEEQLPCASYHPVQLYVRTSLRYLPPMTDLAIGSLLVSIYKHPQW